MSLGRGRIVLIGLRGSGKTSVGRLLARRLGIAHLDSDECIEKAAGRAVREIFAVDGERRFRAIEQAELVQLMAGDDEAVISVGGGAVLSAENRALLQDATCVWLTATPRELRRRLAADDRTAGLRPSLTGADPLDEIEAVLAARRPLYAGLADIEVDTTGRPIEQAVEEVMQRLATLASQSRKVGE